MKKTIIKLGAAVAALGLFATACSDSSTSGDSTAGSSESYKIGINQLVSHPSLDATAEGFKDAFKDAGVDVEFDEQNAQADQSTVNNIASTFAQDADMDLVMAIATPAAVTTASTVTDKPVIFGAVTDPTAAGIVADWDAPGGNVTGVSDMAPVDKQVELILDIVPDAKTIGIPYSSSEANSVVQVEQAKEAAKEHGVEIKEVTVTNSSEVQQAANTLTDVDAIYAITDNAVISAFESVAQVGEAHGIPVIAAEADTVARGAVATYGLDFYTQGKQAGEMALRILQDGEDPATMPVERMPDEDLKYTVNEQAAQRMGVEIPQEILDEAETVDGE